MCSYSWRVPLTAYGRLEILGVGDIGELGPGEGAPVTFDWRWSYSASGLLLWGVLVLAFVLVRENRDPRALLILAPLVFLSLLWPAFKRVAAMPSGDHPMFDALFWSLTIGLTVLWLLAHKLASARWFARFLIAFGVLIVGAGIGAAAYSPGSFEEVTTIFAFLAFVLVSAYALAGRVCRKRYRPSRFMAWFAAGTFAGSILAIHALFLLWSAILSSWPHDIVEVLIETGIAGLLFGLAVYVVNVPYLLTAFRSPLYGKRFRACLHLDAP